MPRTSLLVAIGLMASAATALAQVGPPAPAAARPDAVVQALDEADQKLAAWDVRGAWGTALKAGYLVERAETRHPQAGRTFVLLMRVALLRGDTPRARTYLGKVAEHAALSPADLQCWADAIAFLAYFPELRPHVLWRQLGEKCYHALSRDAVKRIEVFGKASAPTSEEVGRFTLEAIRASSRITRRCREPEVGLLVLAAAQRLLNRFASEVRGKEAHDARGMLARRIDREAGNVRQRLYAAAARSDTAEDRFGIPRNPGLAFLIGECFRACEHAEGTRLHAPSERSTSLSYEKLRLSRGALMMSANLCYRAALAKEPDHTGAAVQLAGVYCRMKSVNAAARVMESLTRALIAPSVAWTGDPVLPPAPRYQTTVTAADQLCQNEGGAEPPPALVAIRVSVERDLIRPYLEHGQRFHPEDTVASWHRFPDVIENNTGFRLMQAWDLDRAAQHARRCIWRGRQRPKAERELIPTALQNLGHLHYLLGDYPRALTYYRESAEVYEHDPVTHNNLGALMGIFGSITLDRKLFDAALEYYQRAVDLAPDYRYAKASLQFMRNVTLNWDRYLKQGDRSPAVVVSFANSFLFAARSISEDQDPKYLQAMQILHQGLRALPDEDEFLDILEKELPDGVDLPADYQPELTLKKMRDHFRRCFEGAVKKYEALLAEHGADNPHLNFLLAEVLRTAWRRYGKEGDSTRAMALYEKTLRAAPDHAAAALGMAELLQARGREKEGIARLDAVVDALLKLWRPWEGEPEVPSEVRVDDVDRLAAATTKRFPDTKTWRSFRTRARARAKAAGDTETAGK